MPARHDSHPWTALAHLLAAAALALCLATAGCSGGTQPSATPESTGASAPARPQAFANDQAAAGSAPAASDAQAAPDAHVVSARYEGAGGEAYLQALAELTADLPVYRGEPYVELDGGEPAFTAAEATTQAFERYGALDELGRCTYAYACLGPETLADGPRENISHIKPSGWHRSEYDFIDGGILFTRAHLIARQLSDENANERNLVTGTRYLNATGMIGFEEATGDYIRETGNHVLYRVTPVFVGQELVARGVWMEAMSMEDGGAGICFNAYVFNVQPGVQIDYATGDNRLADDAADTTGAAAAPGTQGSSAQASASQADAAGQPAFDCAYVLNVKSMRFHLPTCDGALTMSDKNRKLSDASRDELVAQGYEPCGTCQP